MATKFYRKASGTKSIPLSNVNPDVYIGNKEKTNIGGQRKNQALLTRFTIPSKPLYGQSKLDRVDASFYFDSLTIGDSYYAVPEAAIYKTKNSDRLTLTEGKQEIDTVKNDDIVIFTSHINDFASIKETFTGNTNAGPDAVEYESQTRAIIRKSLHYVHPGSLYKKSRHSSNWYQGGPFFNEKNDYTVREIKDIYGVKASEIGNILGVDDDTIIVPVKLTGNDTGWKGTHRTVYATAEPVEGKTGKTLKIMVKDSGIVKFQAQSSTKGEAVVYGDEITPANTIFEWAQGDNEYHGDGATTNSTELAATGYLRFNSDKYLTGSKSAEMRTYFKAGSEGEESIYPPKGKDESNNLLGTNRQEVKLCKKFIPYPMKHPAKPSFRGQRLEKNSQDANVFANNIEVDLNIGSLAPAHFDGSGVMTLRRSFVITFGAVEPESDDDLFSYMEKHRDTELSYNGDNQVAFHDQSTTNDSTVKPFSCIAFVNTRDKGIGVVQPGIVYDTGSADGQHSSVISLDKGSHDCLVSSNIFGSNTAGTDFLDKWIRLNFLFAPQTYSKQISRTGMNTINRLKPGVSSNTGYGSGGGSHCHLIVSDISDGKFLTFTPGGSTTENNYIELNNICHEHSTADIANWPMHMTFWLCNHPINNGDQAHSSTTYNDETAGSQVFIDKVAFKDFNYEIENPNRKELNEAPDVITIGAGKGFISTDGKDTSATHQNQSTNPTTSSVRDVTPVMMSIGATNPAHLGYITGNDKTRHNWQSDLCTAIYFQDFKCNNLNNIAEIPTENMIATYSFAGGDEAFSTDSSTSGGAVTSYNANPQWGNVHSTHYGLRGGLSPASGDIDEIRAQTPGLLINSLEGDSSDPHVNIGIKDLSTGYILNDNSSSTTLVVRPDGSNDSAQGEKMRQGCPFRVGDTLIIRSEDDTSGAQVESTITQIAPNSSDSNDWTLTRNNSTSVSSSDQIYIKNKEGLVRNFSSKGMMWINTNRTKAGTDLDHAFAKRECGPASARVTEIELDDSLVTLKVDTLKPLKLGKDEEYMVYLYLGTTDSLNWTRTETSYTAADGQHSQTTTCELDSTTTNAKAGLKLESIDPETNEITFLWDGKAEDGSTQLITKANLPILMVSPYRYWIHMNIDVRDYSGSYPTVIKNTNRTYDDTQDYNGGSPSTLQPTRTYGTFAVMKNVFARWDGSTYHTDDTGATLATKGTLTTTDTTIELSAVASNGSLKTGDFIRIRETDGSDEEIMYVTQGPGATDSAGASLGNDFIRVVRGVAGTYVSDPTAKDTSTTPDQALRVGIARAGGRNIEAVTAHWATGEEISGNVDKLVSGGSLDTVAEARNVGTTYKENPLNFESVSGVVGAYSNRWLATEVDKDGIYEIETDFGFGAYDEVEKEGGYLSKSIIKAGQYNEFRMYDIKKSKEVEEGKQLDLLLRFKDNTIPHEAEVTTKHNFENTPFITAVFEDERPDAPKLTVGPSEIDAFNVEFNWDVVGDDLWYGFLHVDTKTIASQYHGKVAHIPLNEDTNTRTEVFLENESNNKVAATGGTFTNSIEGLAGYTKHFSGSDFLSFADFTAPTTEMSISLHVIPDDSPTGDEYLIYKYATSSLEDYSIYLDSSNRVNAKVYPHGETTNPITLQSAAIEIDGDKPTNVILTVDTKLVGANVKLFIDGKLVDQSGLIKATHTTNNWKLDTNIKDSSGALYVGAKYTSGTVNYFDGRLEEIVIYNKVLYPVSPSDVSYTLTKPLQEISNGTPISYMGRLFIKDYHNIRGATTDEVASSSNVSFKKAGFRLV